jgi:CrcB protein
VTAVVAQFAAVGVGAAFGAWVRWGLSAWLNPKLPQWPLGTLAANLIGGYLIGIAIAFFVARPGLSPEWQLFAINGLLGGLTTFSTFSAEVTQLLLRGDWLAGAGLAAMHLAGSLLLTVAGIATFRALA